MIFLKNPKITGIIIFISIIAGFISYFNSTTFNVYWYEYEMNLIDEAKCSPILNSDTLFYSHKVLVRNLTTSISDTSRNIGIKRHEFKIYYPGTAKISDIRSIGDALIQDSPCKSYRIKFKGEEAPYQQIFYYVLAGLFIAGLLNWLPVLRHK